ncbi:hypothetical protein [Gloeobacter kilaueensis]|uniref:hypothetical protein n=1 Tax=Gloeobacter kilaueensis TaxID=1416614 RepID=UPI00059CDB48|nr:hypothetical protein [Gloeobacter kilaueensis]
MTTRITLDVPDEIYRRAQDLAQVSGREVREVLSEALALSLAPVSPAPESGDFTAAEKLSDEQVLALCELQLPEQQDQHLSELLNRQQAGMLGEFERLELAGLMQIYQFQLLRKAQALREAVQRRLLPPLSP